MADHSVAPKVQTMGRTPPQVSSEERDEDELLIDEEENTSFRKLKDL